MSKLGEFELLVLLSLLRQADAPYANRVRDDLEENAGRQVTRGALYRTIDRLTGKVNEQGLTLVPLQIYFVHGLAKVELALAKGRRTYDKRKKIADREQQREMDRARRR